MGQVGSVQGTWEAPPGLVLFYILSMVRFAFTLPYILFSGFSFLCPKHVIIKTTRTKKIKIKARSLQLRVGVD